MIGCHFYLLYFPVDAQIPYVRSHRAAGALNRGVDRSCHEGKRVPGSSRANADDRLSADSRSPIERGNGVVETRDPGCTLLDGQVHDLIRKPRNCMPLIFPAAPVYGKEMAIQNASGKGLG
jgi:hypothetical protein